MQPIKTRAYARAGLLGNPSDGFGGKTISFSIGQYFAEVEMAVSERLVIKPQSADLNEFESIEDLVNRVERQGYYGAVRLIKATIKRFYEYVKLVDPAHPLEKNLTLSYQSNIPRSVGMAGSSAIIVATLRGLEKFYSISVEQDVIPSLALSVERNELGIPAGLQDRVIQCYQGMVSMDFSADVTTEKFGMECGAYSPLARTPLFDQLYISFGDEAGQPTEVLHNDLTNRYRAGDETVVLAMQQFASFAEQGRAAIANQDIELLHELVNANFDLRRSICQLHPAHIGMIECARSAGGSAKYCGSGGAIVGFCSENNFPRLCEDLKRIGSTTIRPRFVEAFAG